MLRINDNSLNGSLIVKTPLLWNQISSSAVYAGSEAGEELSSRSIVMNFIDNLNENVSSYTENVLPFTLSVSKSTPFSTNKEAKRQNIWTFRAHRHIC